MTYLKMSSTIEPGSGLGEWIKQKRVERKLSLRELAELAGIAHSSLDKAERGGGVRESTLELIVRALAGEEADTEELRELMVEARRVRAGLSELEAQPDEEYLQNALMGYTGSDPVLTAARATAESVSRAIKRAGPDLTAEEAGEYVARGRRKGITRIDE